MRWKTFFKLTAGLSILMAATMFVIHKSHPVILKWLSGSARIIGKPINATVYTDGMKNNDIKVYRVDTYWNGEVTNDYLLNLKTFDKVGMLKFINIDLKENWVGRPVSTAKDDYDIVNGFLFQSDVSYHCADFKDDMKGFNFDPRLAYINKQIRFNVPPGWLKFGSIVINLN